MTHDEHKPAGPQRGEASGAETDALGADPALHPDGALTGVQPESLAAVTGVQLAQGIGHQQARGFWAEAWSTVIRRPGAIFGLSWIAVVGFFAVFSPLLASGHPLLLERGGERSSPLWDFLSRTDLTLVVGTVCGLALFLLPGAWAKSTRVGAIVLGSVQVALTFAGIALVGALLASTFGEDRAEAWRALWWYPPAVAVPVAAVVAGALWFVRPLRSRALLFGVLVTGALLASGASVVKWSPPALESFDYRDAVAAGDAEAVYTLVPFSPAETRTSWYQKPPVTEVPLETGLDDTFYLGTDLNGRDVLSQLMHASRLSISIGLVSTSIAVTIGVTLGALMGYFGGWVDLLLYRVVEIFMAIPVLFLLIVAAAVLPRNTYVMMIIIGCVSWTGAARFTRAEFYKLRNQDFVQSARAVGLPLRSILFKHMLPNGVTPVLVDASFAIAAAILIEAILSFLALGPANQASWGALLSNAKSPEGLFVWWLAIFPGLAIFLTVLAYNLIGEAFRDAIDPKLKKARV